MQKKKQLKAQARILIHNETMTHKIELCVMNRNLTIMVVK